MRNAKAERDIDIKAVHVSSVSQGKNGGFTLHQIRKSIFVSFDSYLRKFVKSLIHSVYENSGTQRFGVEK